MIFNMIAQGSGSTPNVISQEVQASGYNTDGTALWFDLDEDMPQNYRILALEVWFGASSTSATANYTFATTHSNKVINLLYVPNSEQTAIDYLIFYGSRSGTNVTMRRLKGQGTRSTSTTPTSYDYRVVLSGTRINVYLPSDTPLFLTTSSTYVYQHYLKVWYEEL